MGFKKLKAELKDRAGQSLAVAWALDPDLLQACQEAVACGFLDRVVLTGPRREIEELVKENQLELGVLQIEDAANPAESAQIAVRLVREGRCSLLMKGHLNTSVLLKAVLNKERGIRAQKLLSHIAIIELPSKRLCLLTDAAMNIKPGLEQKSQILDNAICFAWSLDLSQPKAAVLTALETVNPQMAETVDAAALAVMGKRGQFSKPAFVDGPLAFDNAYSKKAAQQKGLSSPVAGQADILLVPEITAGNILYKAFAHAAGFKTAGIIYGASSPIILTSRSDSRDNKLNAIAAACRSLPGS
ncbi:MAG: bifunctional enoyl-CoA hydratase/phosphate acetyltransferase [Firmicutes bacterium]|nr:bifunctional enoyl-CoA hydratase/phosphate acetyltransferase [Bacillota bacterium]